jgi:hypothetical protein
MAAGFGGGFALSLVLIYLLHTLSNRGVGSSSEIERETGVSVYAKIPKTQISRKLPGVNDKRFILAKADSEDLAVEKMRTLRTALEFSFLDEGGRVLMVTGIVPGAGKSFVSLNLTYLFAKQEKRVLFIDADLRKSRLSHKHERASPMSSPSPAHLTMSSLTWAKAPTSCRRVPAWQTLAKCSVPRHLPNWFRNADPNSTSSLSTPRLLHSFRTPRPSPS